MTILSRLLTAEKKVSVNDPTVWYRVVRLGDELCDWVVRKCHEAGHEAGGFGEECLTFEMRGSCRALRCVMKCMTWKVPCQCCRISESWSWRSSPTDWYTRTPVDGKAEREPDCRVVEPARAEMFHDWHKAIRYRRSWWQHQHTCAGRWCSEVQGLGRARGAVAFPKERDIRVGATES